MFQIAIVGRPNVGKSTLFNRLCGLRKSIVGNEEGITRDRIDGTVNWDGHWLGLTDTGGIVPGSREPIPSKVREQALAAVDGAKLLLLVVDGLVGPTGLDQQLAALVRRSDRPVWLVVNKLDSEEKRHEALTFHVLGFPEVYPVSAEHNLGVEELKNALVAECGEPQESVGTKAAEIGVAVIGRPNVGKSSLVNRLLGDERSIVSETPGTTRDSVDSILEHDGAHYRIIDTAGIRKRGKPRGHAERVSVVLAQKSVGLADVVILLLDAEEGVTKTDAAVGGYAHESGRALIIVLNKWDKIADKGRALKEQKDSIHRKMRYLSYAPIIEMSAKTGQNVRPLFQLIQRAHEGSRLRVATGTLNNIFVPDLSRPPAGSERRGLDIRYITQVQSRQPTFVVFTGRSKRLHFSDERYLVNELRRRFHFFASPILIRQRFKSRS